MKGGGGIASTGDYAAASFAARIVPAPGPARGLCVSWLAPAATVVGHALRILRAPRVPHDELFLVARSPANADAIAGKSSNHGRAVHHFAEALNRRLGYSATRFAVQQFRGGRRLGCKLNVKDVSSEHCRLQKKITLARLDRRERQTGQWEEVLLEKSTSCLPGVGPPVGICPAPRRPARHGCPATRRALSAAVQKTHGRAQRRRGEHADRHLAGDA